MELSNRDKAVVIISNAIAVYAISAEKGSIPKNQSMIDFIMKVVPEEVKSEISIGLIDNVFEYVSNQHLELS
jgi:hypothetical protein